MSTQVTCISFLYNTEELMSSVNASWATDMLELCLKMHKPGHLCSPPDLVDLTIKIGSYRFFYFLKIRMFYCITFPQYGFWTWLIFAECTFRVLPCIKIIFRCLFLIRLSKELEIIHAWQK